MEGSSNSRAPIMEEIVKDFKGRRFALLKALTTEVEEFFQLCDPEKGTLCLYGLPDEKWEVRLPFQIVPTELPEPTIGINLLRDAMERKDWLALVAAQCDAWLLSVAFCSAGKHGFHRADRDHLFDMLSVRPTIFELVTGGRKQEELCGECGKEFGMNDWWVRCHFCRRWFHGECIKITPPMSQQIKRFKCLSC